MNMSNENILFIADYVQISKSTSDDIQQIITKLNIILPIILFAFCFLGFLGNLVTYLQRELRRNTCCIYLLCGSVVDILCIFINVFSNFLYTQCGISIPWHSILAL